VRSAFRRRCCAAGTAGAGDALREVHFPSEARPWFVASLGDTRPPATDLRRAVLSGWAGAEAAAVRSARESLQTNDRCARRSRGATVSSHGGAEADAGEIVATCASQPHAEIAAGDVGSGRPSWRYRRCWCHGKRLPAALMAPTEILATQHYLAMRKLRSGRAAATDCPADRLAE